MAIRSLVPRLPDYVQVIEEQCMERVQSFIAKYYLLFMFMLMLAFYDQNTHYCVAFC